MADYYPLLVRALSSLPQKTGEHRKAVYDRARTALLRQLRGVDPPLPEGEIIRERQALEEAIKRSEADFPPEPVAAEPDLAEPERSPPRELAASPPPDDADDAGAHAEAEAEAPPPEGAAGGHDAAGERASGSSRADWEARRRGEPSGAEASRNGLDEAAAADEARNGRRGAVRSRQAAASQRSSTARRGASWQKLVLFALVAAVIIGAVAVLVLNRDSFFGEEAARSGAVPTIAADQPKSADRVAPSSSDAARRPPTPTRIPAAGTARAQLLEESPDGSTPQSFEGTVTWKTESFNAGPGLPPDVGIRADVAIPERQIAISFVVRRNVDQTLPASHTIDIGFKLPQDFAFGGIGSIPFVGVKPNFQAQGVPLSGLPVRINPTFFLVGLAPQPAERQRNLVLLQRAATFELPIVYTNNKKAKVSFDKGANGIQIFTDVFNNWGEYIAPPEPQRPEGGSGSTQ